MTGKPGKLPISAVMVIYNEEALLERSLRSFADLVDEIIVVHDGPCKDRSLEIARKYTDNVFELERSGSAEWHRPRTYERARHEWILEVDADEYLSPELRVALPDLDYSAVDLFNVTWPTVRFGRRLRRGFKGALFNKWKLYRIGVTHEYPKASGERLVSKRVPQPLLHEPRYDDVSWSTFVQKWLPRAKVHASEYLADFRTIPKWNYQQAEWDQPTRWFIRHPLVGGMLIVPPLHWCLGIRNCVTERSWFCLKYGFFSGLYYFYVFSIVLRMRGKAGV